MGTYQQHMAASSHQAQLPASSDFLSQLKRDHPGAVGISSLPQLIQAEGCR